MTTKRLPGICTHKAPCGRECTLASDHRHQWHCCSKPTCVFCHDRDWTRPVVAWTEAEADLRARMDDMDKASAQLAGVAVLVLLVASGWWG